MMFSVLIVDDYDVMRGIVRRVLAMSGLHLADVFEAGDGLQALALLEKHHVDIVLADLNMPVMNGVELIAEMRRIPAFAAIPVIVVSTEGRVSRIEDIMKSGASGFLTKPFRPEEAAKLIAEALGAKTDGRYREYPRESDF
jgi:two-component system chemotaxis response regulator CheY